MEAAKEKSLLETILEQIKIIVVIYGIIIVVHMVSMGTPLPGLLKSTVVSFIMVAIAKMCIRDRHWSSLPTMRKSIWA